jgi:hypothetical protein
MSEVTSPAPEVLPYTDKPQQLYGFEIFLGRHAWAIAPAVFAVLTLGMFYDVLFSSKFVVSSASTDLALQFIPWRDFGFSQLRAGNLPLWNPHVFGGTPYFAGFQAALLYPPNWLHLLLPMNVAINWVLALHVFLAGYFTYLWCRGRHIGVGGSILGGVMFMFSGQYFLHLYAGHLPHVAIIVWAPLMFLTIDKLAETGEMRWCLLGILATAMEILAGHPQYVYYTGMILTVYAALRLIWGEHRKAVVLGFVVMYGGAVMLTAIQLLPGMQAVSEQVRSGGTSYEFASTFALPPQNLITLVAPNFFGKLPLGSEPMGEAYWGAGYLWELSLFVSVTGLILAIFGAIRGTQRDPSAGIVLIILFVVTLALGLGRHIYPLYYPLFKYLPVYGSFRGAVKFCYLMTLTFSVLAAVGFDNLLKDRRVPWAFIYSILVVSIVLFAFGAMVGSSARDGNQGWWGQYARQMIYDEWKSGEYFLMHPDEFNSPEFMGRLSTISGATAANAAYLGAGTLAVVAAILFAARFHRALPYVLILTATAEMFIFARSTRALMDPATTPSLNLPVNWMSAIQSHPRDQRVYLSNPNIALSLNVDGIWGYDPGVLKRYAEAIAYFIGQPPDKADQYLLLGKQVLPSTKILRMLRCSLLLAEGTPDPIPVANPLPVALLISDWVKLPTRDTTLGYVASPTFDATKSVALESDPGVPSTSMAFPPGTVHVGEITTDTVDIDATVDRPSILLVTNNYTTGWRVNPIASGQSDYRIMPANYTLLGIPLEKGHHHFILEYNPLAFRAGRVVSILSVLALLGWSFLLMRRKA